MRANKRIKLQNREYNEYNEEDLVFAKVKGYPFWPAKIIKRWKKANEDYMYQVIFYGTYEYGNLNEKNIVIFNDKTLLIYGSPRKNGLFSLAIDEIKNRPDCIREANNQDETNIDLGEWEVDKIIDSREIEGRIEYLIHWKGFDESSRTWEPEGHLNESCSKLLNEFNAQKMSFHDQNTGPSTNEQSLSVLSSLNSMKVSNGQNRKISFLNMFYDEEEGENTDDGGDA